MKKDISTIEQITQKIYYLRGVKGSERNKLYFQAIRFMSDLVNSIERIRSNSRLFRVIRD